MAIRIKMIDTLKETNEMLIYNDKFIGGHIAKNDEKYIVRDNTELTKLVLSSTELYPGRSTSGHKHEGQEEVYFFVSGSGEMQVGPEQFKVTAGDIVLIPDGEFHKVINTAPASNYTRPAKKAGKPLVFNCVFDGRRDQKKYKNYNLMLRKFLRNIDPLWVCSAMLLAFLAAVFPYIVIMDLPGAGL